MLSDGRLDGTQTSVASMPKPRCYVCGRQLMNDAIKLADVICHSLDDLIVSTGQRSQLSVHVVAQCPSSTEAAAVISEAAGLKIY